MQFFRVHEVRQPQVGFSLFWKKLLGGSLKITPGPPARPPVYLNKIIVKSVPDKIKEVETSK